MKAAAQSRERGLGEEEEQEEDTEEEEEEDRTGTARSTNSHDASWRRAPPDNRGLAFNEEQKVHALVQQLRKEVHDFDGACDWLLQVTVKQHDGKCEDGERIDASKVQTAKNKKKAARRKSSHSPSRRRTGVGKTAGSSRMRGAKRYSGYGFPYEGT